MVSMSVVDYHLLHYLKKKLYQEPPQYKILFKSQLQCQNQNVSQPGSEDAVFLLKNDKRKAQFFGLKHCNNAWFCPVCSARQMSKRKKEIDAAYGYFSSKGYKAMMFTFTIPHNRWFSAEDSIQILRNSMVKMQKRAQVKKRKRKFESNAWSRFFRDMELCHYVRAGEVTFGKKNGWHPHFHALYWTKVDLQKAADYEKSVNEYWLKIVKQETLARFKKTKAEKYTEEEIVAAVERIYNNLHREESFFISKTDDGKIANIKSSDYICGWGGDQELTGSKRKTARAENRYSQFTLLEMAAGYTQGDLSREEAWQFFLEFAVAVKKTGFKRIKFSQSKDENGKTIHNYIKEYLLTEKYQEVIKKNCTAKWDVVCWFTKQQWFKICELDRIFPIKSNILYLAYDDRLLREYLESYNIFAFDNTEHSKQFLIEDLFNKAA